MKSQEATSSYVDWNEVKITPETDGHYLTHHANGDMHVTEWMKSTRWIWLPEFKCEDYPITHWAKLPDAPRKE